jgi:hypothetical protein
MARAASMRSNLDRAVGSGRPVDRRRVQQRGKDAVADPGHHTKKSLPSPSLSLSLSPSQKYQVSFKPPKECVDFYWSFAFEGEFDQDIVDQKLAAARTDAAAKAKCESPPVLVVMVFGGQGGLDRAATLLKFVPIGRAWKAWAYLRSPSRPVAAEKPNLGTENLIRRFPPPAPPKKITKNNPNNSERPPQAF